jgi:hypothetical protein
VARRARPCRRMLDLAPPPARWLRQHWSPEWRSAQGRRGRTPRSEPGSREPARRPRPPGSGSRRASPRSSPLAGQSRTSWRPSLLAAHPPTAVGADRAPSSSQPDPRSRTKKGAGPHGRDRLLEGAFQALATVGVCSRPTTPCWRDRAMPGPPRDADALAFANSSVIDHGVRRVAALGQADASQRRSAGK